MKSRNNLAIGIVLTLLLGILPTDNQAAKEVVRPVEIKSKRLVIYDDATYAKLAQLWQEYYGTFPSEYAYANWMYAARYAGDEKYHELLKRGVEEYPANPTLLYLKAIEHHGAPDNAEGRKYLERAIALDPAYADAWFGLVTHYMDSGEEEQLDLALRRLLESGVITDEVMDYNYNMLVGLEENAILITNGDNDTYPGWILTRILKDRPDVTIVNRSLLNSPWYPTYMIECGLPRFITQSELEELRNGMLQRWSKDTPFPPAAGPFGDTLILRIIASAERADRPVYFARTLYRTEMLAGVLENGRNLGLVTLVTSSEAAYAAQLRNVYRRWVDVFRTGGLESWRLHHAPAADAGRSLLPNYASGMVQDLATLKAHAPELRLGLFHWYTQYLEELLPGDMRSYVARTWCRYASDVEEVATWVKNQGLECSEQPKGPESAKQ